MHITHLPGGGRVCVYGGGGVNKRNGTYRLPRITELDGAEPHPVFLTLALDKEAPTRALGLGRAVFGNVVTAHPKGRTEYIRSQLPSLC